MSSLIKIRLFILVLQFLIGVNCRNETTRNGKTYFLQLKNVGDGELSYKPIWTKHISGKHGKNAEEYEIIGRLIQTDDVTKESKEDDSIEVIDENWNKNTKISIGDYPDKLSEFYAAFQSQELNKINNSTELRFIFEVDATDNEIFKYDLDNLDIDNETIVDAELYVYRIENEKNKIKEGGDFNYVARLYQITENVTNAELSREKPDVHRLLNVVYVPSINDGWQIFKVKTAIKNWLTNGDENLGFLVTFKDNADKLINVNFAHKNTSDEQYQSFIVLYLKDQKNKTLTNSKDSTIIYKSNIKGMKMLRYGEIPCSRHIWYVNFHDLEWDKFILEPKGYMAYKCKGSCKSPMCADFSNYGKILSLYKRKSEEYSGPGCVPISFKPLLMMYIDNRNNVIIRYYEDMIVDKCGCR